MKNIFLRTLETTLKKVSIIFCILTSVIVGSIVISTGRGGMGVMAYQQLLEQNLMMQHVLVFFVIDGFVLMATTISNATGLIASEVHEGTFKLLAAKPNLRTQILAGKVLGVIAGQIILLAISLFSYFSTIVIVKAIDGNVIREMVSYFPAYFLYGLVVILFFTAVSTLLSCVFKRKITAMLPLLAVVMIALAFFPIQRVMTSLTGKAPSAVMSLIDINYHFSLIFKSFVEMVDTIKPNRIMANLMNLFSVQKLDADVTRSQWGSDILLANKTLSAFPIILFYGAVAAASYVSSFAIIKKKDI
ncbi:MAG TPA: ABC transporter permease subunit [Erysipelotrichaceae bacterium]|nr:ABC transporter permease subunit [Erysipelotrichaceae bacterium]HQB31708.1 ABC transporter permease subunit [Erysipelotrichaceae bacterium]